MKRERAARMSSIDFETTITSFLDIVGNAQTPDTARHFLESTGWQLPQAIQLFYASNDEELRPPIPVRRQILYDGSQLDSLPDSEEVDLNLRELEDNLAGLYVPPHDLIFDGSFDKAKESASVQNKWLVVNLQSRTEFSSHMLNRDTWNNATVAEIIGNYFVFYQKFDDTVEGNKVRAFYGLDSVPAVVVIDPVTGQKMKSWSGMVEPERFLEDVVPFMDSSPNEHLAASLSRKRRRLAVVAAPMEDEPQEEEEEEEDSRIKKKLPKLPEEPEGDRTGLCRVGVRFPDGRRVKRNFLRTDPIQLLWSFCYSELLHQEEEEESNGGFRLVYAVPGAARSLDYDDRSTFDESGIANSLISLVFY